MMDQIASIDYNCRQKARLGSAQPIANAVAADAVPKLLMNLNRGYRIGVQPHRNS